MTEIEDPMGREPLIDPTALAVLAELAPDEPSFLLGLIDTFIVRASELADQLGTSIAAGDVRTVRDIAHEFCSTSLQMGALPASRIARQLADQARPTSAAGSTEIERLGKELVEAMREAIDAIGDLRGSLAGDR